MILWVNGAYVIGKTSVCNELQNRLPVSHLFDPEAIGDVSRNVLPPSLGHGLPIVGGMICLS